MPVLGVSAGDFLGTGPFLIVHPGQIRPEAATRGDQSAFVELT